jgi:TolB-like protein/Tfp pilus assembly protein PilF
MSEHGSIKFWQEIGRRNVLRVAAVYIGFAWMVIHSGVVMGEALELPHWVMRLVSGLLIVGFPVVVAFAWVYEITPEGLKRAVEVEKDASLTHRTAQRLNVVIIALMILLAGLYGADRFLLPHETAEEAHTTKESVPKGTVGEGISIAVLPFLNLSGDPSQEFFSDGMTEEITSALAKVKTLRVVGRTSAFKFKGQNDDLRSIGKALSASHILEGSVRKEGNQIRVTAQLIRADDGTHIWTDNYDRELKSVFAIQDDIAQAIAGALRIPLGLQPGETLVSSRTNNTETYQQYLRARALFRVRGNGSPLTESIGLLEQVVSRDPGYAPAWALLAQSYDLSPLFDKVLTQGSGEELHDAAKAALSKAEVAARRAIELDPRNADAIASLGQAKALRGGFLEAEDLFKQALTIDAVNLEALNWYSLLVGTVGRLKEAVMLRQRLSSLEPLVPTFSANTARLLWVNGETEAALSIAKALPLDFNGRTTILARIYAAMGRYGEAADVMLTTPQGTYPSGTVETAAQLLRMAPASAAQQDSPIFGDLDFVYLHVGAPERALSEFRRQAEVGYLGYGPVYLHPSYASARKMEGFKSFARKSGLIEYWRARGWSGPCHPLGADDFECS